MTLAVLFVPIAFALLLAFVPARGPARALALLSAAATFALALLLPGDAGVSVPWIPGFGATFSLSPAGPGGVLVGAAALVVFPTVLWAGARVAERTHLLLALLLAMQGALNGLFLAKDLVLFYVFWEAALIASLLMLVGWGGPRRREATMKYLVYAVAGSFLMLVSILAIKPLSGAASYALADLLAATPSLPVATQAWLLAGFAVAFAVKTPLWPVHGWLIDFHEQNHPSGVADVAGTLYKVGGFGFFVWALPLLPDAAAAWSPALLLLAAATAVLAGLLATAQRDLKRLLAYASLSHMGIVAAGVFALHDAGGAGAMYLLAAQMVSTGGLFLLAGMLYARRGTFDLADHGGLARSAPALAAVFLLVLFASIGVPGLSNFPGEFLALLGAFAASPWLGALATLAVIAAGVVGVNLYQRVFQGPAARPVADLAPLEIAVLAPVVAGVLWLGIAPAPQLARIEGREAPAAGAALEAPAPGAPALEAPALGAPAPGGGAPAADGAAPEPAPLATLPGGGDR